MQLMVMFSILTSGTVMEVPVSTAACWIAVRRVGGGGKLCLVCRVPDVVTLRCCETERLRG